MSKLQEHYNNEEDFLNTESNFLAKLYVKQHKTPLGVRLPTNYELREWLITQAGFENCEFYVNSSRFVTMTKAKISIRVENRHFIRQVIGTIFGVLFLGLFTLVIYYLACLLSYSK